jgi:hypothetical protein
MLKKEYYKDHAVQKLNYFVLHLKGDRALTIAIISNVAISAYLFCRCYLHHKILLLNRIDHMIKVFFAFCISYSSIGICINA